MNSNKMKIQVESEVGKLQGVIMHRPGNEVENMTPANAKRALYSDILNLAVTNKEYSQLSGVLEKVSKVYYVTDLLSEVLENQDVRNRLISKVTEDCISPNIKNYLIEQSPKKLAEVLIEGFPLPRNTLSNYLSKEYYALQPLHNFFYMRDASSAILNNVLINKMANGVRQREALIMETIFEHNSNFITRSFNPLHSRSYNNKITMEGGDILIARKDVLLIGMGSRTTSYGIDYIAEKIESREFPRTIIVQELPHTPESFIHLDMVFTLLDYDKCMVYEPIILKNNKYSTIKMTVYNGKIQSIEQKENILDALSSVNMNMKTILCGGSNVNNQEREQWHSGANFFAFAPGKVIGYERNVHTVEAMNKAGFDVVSAKEIIADKVDINKLKKVVVTIHGSELSRGGGGARCMTMPINRVEN